MCIYENPIWDARDDVSIPLDWHHADKLALRLEFFNGFGLSIHFSLLLLLAIAYGNYIQKSILVKQLLTNRIANAIVFANKI